MFWGPTGEQVAKRRRHLNCRVTEEQASQGTTACQAEERPDARVGLETRTKSALHRSHTGREGVL